MNILKKTLFLLLISMITPVYATDEAKEQRWASQIVDFLVEGEALWLKADGRKFLGIYTPAAMAEPLGAVIILHGRGVHPDWPQVIQPLRIELPRKGWATMSLQMPVLANDATDKDYIPLFDEVPARIQAALDFLSRHKHNNVILIGHSLGTSMATDYLANHHDQRIKAFVGIGMAGNRQAAEYLVLDNVASLLRLKVPVLDVYGSNTNEPILNSVERRAYAVYQPRNDHSRQIMIKGAGHLFQGEKNENALLQAITSWLAQSTNAVTTTKVVSKNKEIK